MEGGREGGRRGGGEDVRWRAEGREGGREEGREGGREGRITGSVHPFLSFCSDSSVSECLEEGEESLASGKTIFKSSPLPITLSSLPHIHPFHLSHIHMYPLSLPSSLPPSLPSPPSLLPSLPPSPSPQTTDVTQTENSLHGDYDFKTLVLPKDQ